MTSFWNLFYLFFFNLFIYLFIFIFIYLFIYFYWTLKYKSFVLTWERVDWDFCDMQLWSSQLVHTVLAHFIAKIQSARIGEVASWQLKNKKKASDWHDAQFNMLLSWFDSIWNIGQKWIKLWRIGTNSKQTSQSKFLCTFHFAILLVKSPVRKWKLKSTTGHFRKATLWIKTYVQVGSSDPI